MTRAAHRHAASGAGHVPTAPTDAQRERLARVRAQTAISAVETQRSIDRAGCGPQPEVPGDLARGAANAVGAPLAGGGAS